MWTQTDIWKLWKCASEMYTWARLFTFLNSKYTPATQALFSLYAVAITGMYMLYG